MPKDDQTTGHNSDFAVEYDVLQEILDDLAQGKKVISEATQRLRQKIKTVIEDQGYHKGALATIRQIDAMSETARAEYLRTFEPMFDAMMEGKWRQEGRDILDDLENADPDAE